MSTLKETCCELKVEECITETEFNNLFNTCIRKLESLGPEFKVDRSLLKLEKPFFKTKIESFIKLNTPVLTKVYNNQAQKHRKIDA